MSTSNINGTNKPKQYFFEQDAVGSRNGTRFLTTHIPAEQVYRNLLESVAFKGESNDRAKADDSASDLHSKAGVVVLATPTQAKNREYQKSDRSIVISSENLPSMTSVNNYINILDQIYDDSAVEVTEDNTTLPKATLFKFKLKTSFTNYLSSVFNLVSSAINDVINELGSLTTRVTTIETTINNPSYTTNIVNDAVPLGVPLPFFGTTPPANYAFCDGQQLKRADFPDLFAAIGSAAFATSGVPADKFALPDLTNRFLKGPGTEQMGTTGGSPTSKIELKHVPDHSHFKGSLGTSSSGSHRHLIRTEGAAGAGDRKIIGGQYYDEGKYTDFAGDHTHTITGDTGTMIGKSSQIDLPVMNPYLSCNYIMRLT